MLPQQGFPSLQLPTPTRIQDFVFNPFCLCVPPAAHVQPHNVSQHIMLDRSRRSHAAHSVPPPLLWQQAIPELAQWNGWDGVILEPQALQQWQQEWDANQQAQQHSPGISGAAPLPQHTSSSVFTGLQRWGKLRSLTLLATMATPHFACQFIQEALACGKLEVALRALEISRFECAGLGTALGEHGAAEAKAHLHLEAAMELMRLRIWTTQQAADAVVPKLVSGLSPPYASPFYIKVSAPACCLLPCPLCFGWHACLQPAGCCLSCIMHPWRPAQRCAALRPQPVNISCMVDCMRAGRGGGRVGSTSMWAASSHMHLGCDRGGHHRTSPTALAMQRPVKSRVSS